MLDVGDVLTNFTYLSGSIALVIKLNDITNMDQMKVESEAVHLLNSRNARLITFEYNYDNSKNVLERSTLLTGGTYFPANSSSYQLVFSSALNKTIDLVKDPKFLNRRVQVTITIYISFRYFANRLLSVYFSCFETHSRVILQRLSEDFTPLTSFQA